MFISIFIFQRDLVADTIESEVVHRCSCKYQTHFIFSIFVYKGILLMFGLFVAYETRKIKVEAINDSKHIGQFHSSSKYKLVPNIRDPILKLKFFPGADLEKYVGVLKCLMFAILIYFSTFFYQCLLDQLFFQHISYKRVHLHYLHPIRAPAFKRILVPNQDVDTGKVYFTIASVASPWVLIKF